MAQPLDTSAIQRLIRGTAARIRTQWALEGATTATILAAATALASIFAVRVQLVAPATGIYLLIVAGLIIIAGAVFSATRKLDDEFVARRIDRASNLADRLSTAIAFERVLKSGKPLDPDTTQDLMQAAIRDGVRAAPRANIRAAAPFTVPKDLRPAILFLAVAALTAGLSIPVRDHTAQLLRANPDHVRPGATTTIEGKNLLHGMPAPLAAMPVSSTMGAPGAPVMPTATNKQTGYVPLDGKIFIGANAEMREVIILDWTATGIKVRIPDDEPPGETKLAVFVKNKSIGEVDLTVVDKKDKDYQDPNAVALDPDEKAYVEAIIAELKNVAKRDQVPELEEFAAKIEKLLEKADNGEITKEELLAELEKAENALSKDGAEPNQAEIQKQLGDVGKELAKDKLTKELGEALQKNDLQKAKEQLEKIAEKLESKDPKEQLSEEEKKELGKQLEKVAKQMEKQQKESEQKDEQKEQKLQEEIRRLEKQKQEAKNEKQKQELERRLEEKKRELQKLQKEQQQKQESEQRRAVKRLQKDLEKAAENLQKPQKKDGSQQEQQEQQEQQDQQASRNLKDAARETGRVDQDQRKQATQKKMSSQMDDLREAMRRAKQRGNKGPNDPFNKNGKNQDFIARARGQKGNGQQWKPGQGQGQGQGQPGQGQGQQNGGQGQGSGSGNNWGTGHDDNLAGDPTGKSGNTKDSDVQGTSSEEGGSTRETILAAAQKGFASKRYQKVIAEYDKQVEEVMRTEKLPASYRRYVKMYFQKIHPDMTKPAEGGAANGETK